MIFLFFTIFTLSEVYKTCKDMRFCYHNIDRVGKWAINNPQFDNTTYEFTADLYNDGHDDNLKLKIYLMQNNSFRIRFLPTNSENFTRYKLYENSLIINQTIINQHLSLKYEQDPTQHILLSEHCTARINQKPFYITITDEFDSKIFINYNQNLVFEHIGERVEPDIWPYYMNDTIKNGATSTSVDFSFKGIDTRLTGFSESDETMNLEDTKENEPKRCSNFDYYSEYGHIPLLHGHSPSEMVSLFWLNPSDTFLKIWKNEEENLRNVRILSEGGNADVVIFTGKLFSILSSYTQLTGRHEMPPIFTLGFHQSKWGYRTQEKVEEVIDEFDKNEFPLDVMWLDVDHLHGYQPFRFNRSAFPNPDSLFQKLNRQNRYLIRINDPHLPHDKTHKQFVYAFENGYFVNKSDGLTPFEGDCWPGLSSWPDFTNPEVRRWWSSLYEYEANESASNVFFWNDMNEPSVFLSVEGTFPKENVYFGGYEQREIKNIYGLMMVSATHEGLIARNSDRNLRPFVLSRSFFAGSQRYSWFWSGDNSPTFEYLRRSIPMLLVAGLCGNPMTGADIGGFNGNTTDELMIRWFQAASFCYPLFRSHTHINSSFREPYLFEKETFNLLKKATLDRYKAAPLWYTAIYSSFKTGVPPVLPLFAFFPEIDELHDIDDQFILAQSLMIAPVLEKDAKKRKIVKPPGIWYNLTNGQKLTDWSTFSIDVFNHSLPVFLRGGSIVPIFTSVGKNMEQTTKSPIRLLIGCDSDGEASGPLYLDDGKTFNYLNGDFLSRMIVFKNGSLRIEALENDINSTRSVTSSLGSFVNDSFINEISFFGLKKKPNLVSEEAVLVCNDEGDMCNMSRFKLFPKDVTPDDGGGDDDDGGGDESDEDEKVDKKLFVIVVSAISAFCGVLIVVVVVLSVVLCLKNRRLGQIGIADSKNADSIVIESQDKLQT